MTNSDSQAGASVTTARIVVNGAQIETGAQTLAALLEELGYQDQPVATAFDGAFVAAPQRRHTRLFNGATVEIVAPRQGG